MIIDLNTTITLLPTGEGAQRADEGLSTSEGIKVTYDSASGKALIRRFAPPSPNERRVPSIYGVRGRKP